MAKSILDQMNQLASTVSVFDIAGKGSSSDTIGHADLSSAEIKKSIRILDAEIVLEEAIREILMHRYEYQIHRQEAHDIKTIFGDSTLEAVQERAAMLDIPNTPKAKAAERKAVKKVMTAIQTENKEFAEFHARVKKGDFSDSLEKANFAEAIEVRYNNQIQNTALGLIDQIERFNRISTMAKPQAITA